MASFLRRSPTARYPQAVVGQQGTASSSLGPLTYQIPVPPLSQSHICIRTPATSSVTQIKESGQRRNGIAGYGFNTAAAGASKSGMCRKSAHQLQPWYDVLLVK